MNLSFNFIIQLILFISILNQESDVLEFKGIYRIESLLNDYVLTDENYSLQFCDKKLKTGQIFRIKKNENNFFYIESKRSHIKLGANDNGHILMVYNPNDKSFAGKLEWNIIKIKENEYVVQNVGNKKFMEINNNFFQCINSLPLPIEKNKLENNQNFIFNFFKLYEEVIIKPEHEEIIKNEPIDVVIKYIDLSDKTLNRTGIKQIQKDEDNEELRYSVRSILKNIPWIRKIFIVMPNEKVRYFKPYDEIKDKIVYIKDKDVLGYDSANIYAFTFNLFRMEKFGLSNNFIYMDDDFFIGKELNKSNFFYYEEKEKRVVPSLLNTEFTPIPKETILGQYQSLFSAKNSLGSQSYMAWYLSLLSTKKFFFEYFKNISFIYPTPTHNAIAYNIQDLKEIYDLISNNYIYANETLNSIQRSILTLQTQHFVDIYELNIKNRKVHSIGSNVIPLELIDLIYLNTELFVINTGGDKNYTENEYLKEKEIMQIKFPNPTPYEIIDNNIDKNKDNYNSEQKNNSEDIINHLNSMNNNNTKNDECKNNINVVNPDECLSCELEKNGLLQINKRQSLIIKISNLLIILMSILIITLFHFNCIERKKNKQRYIQIINDNESGYNK